jgi:hypothetical protein
MPAMRTGSRCFAITLLRVQESPTLSSGETSLVGGRGDRGWAGGSIASAELHCR